LFGDEGCSLISTLDETVSRSFNFALNILFGRINFGRHYYGSFFDFFVVIECSLSVIVQEELGANSFAVS